MSLPSLYLDAFVEVARLKSFSKAASNLNVTQSALSQRVLNLEEEIGSSLFIRDPSGVRLTELGQRLLRFCHSKNLLEAEFMETLKPKDAEGLSGLIRIVGFSTVTRSVLMPILAGILKENPMVSVEVHTAELRDIPPLLFSGSCDLVLVTQSIEKQGIENVLLGAEENVLIQSTSKSARQDIYLDHDQEDTTTFDFFRLQGKKFPNLKRNYLGDIYSIIDGVRLGMGRAVVPLHLVEDQKGVEIVKGYTPMKVPIYLSYYAQAFYTELHTAVTTRIQQGSAKLIGKMSQKN